MEVQNNGTGGNVVSSMVAEFTKAYNKKSEDEEDIMSPFVGIDKSTVLQEAEAAFNDPSVVKHQPRLCCTLITKLLYLLTQGETFSGNEATNVFFAVTKLFGSQDHNLRRMTYLFLKEVAETTDSQDIIIVTASLTKDMNSAVDLYRANSIRVLCKIIDGTHLGQIERYIKQAVVDRNLQVSSCALVSGNQMVADPLKRDIVRRWVNEVQEAVSSKRGGMVEYHALSLLYAIKAHDKLAVSKLVSQLGRSTPKSPLAMCLLIRYTSRLLEQDLAAANAQAAYEFLEGCLTHRNEMVIYEAARAICRLPEVNASDLAPAITVLQMMLTSERAAQRFAAVRTLNEVAISHPMSVTKCNDDMEAVIHDSNRSIATLAIITLLKSGSENRVDRLMKQVSQFMSEIADEFKIVVVKAIRALCLKYPSKNRTLLNFLSQVLREEGGLEYKKVIVDTIIELMNLIEGNVKEVKEIGLLHLCEFIEDCEFTTLCAQILHCIGDYGPKTRKPAKFIRFIYNRSILENAHVRAAACSALGKFGAEVPALRPSIIILLQRCKQDEDDEVRDRAATLLSMLRQDETEAITGKMPVQVHTLQRSLELYRQRPTDGALTFDALPVVEDTEVRDSVKAQNGVDFDEPVPSASKPAEKANAAEELYANPELAHLGPVFKSSPPVELTESETEYLVRCVKHVFADGHVVLQFQLKNTLNDQLLLNCEMDLEETDSDQYEVELKTKVDKLPFDVTKSAFVVLNRVDPDFSLATFAAELKFQVVDVDPEDGDYDPDAEAFDEVYPVEELEISVADFMAKTSVADFKQQWEVLGDQAQMLEQFVLPPFKSLSEAVTTVCDFLGMLPCEGTAAVNRASQSHTVLLSGTFLGGKKTLVRANLAIADAKTVLKMQVRSTDAHISQAVVDGIR